MENANPIKSRLHTNTHTHRSHTQTGGGTMNSPFGILKRLLSGSSSKGRDRAGSSNCDISVSSGTNAALAATLRSMGDRKGLSLADVTGRAPSQEQQEEDAVGMVAAIEESGSPHLAVGKPASSTAPPPSAAGETAVAVAVPMEEAAPDAEEVPRMTIGMSMSFRWVLFSTHTAQFDNHWFICTYLPTLINTTGLWRRTPSGRSSCPSTRSSSASSAAPSASPGPFRRRYVGEKSDTSIASFHPTHIPRTPNSTRPSRSRR